MLHIKAHHGFILRLIMALYLSWVYIKVHHGSVLILSLYSGSTRLYIDAPHVAHHGFNFHRFATLRLRVTTAPPRETMRLIHLARG